MNPPIAIIGFGGHGRVVAAALQAAGHAIVAATDLEPARFAKQRLDFAVISDEALTQRYSPEQVRLVCGIGTIWPCGADSHRMRAIAKFKMQGYEFAGLQHPFGWVAPDVRLADTCQIHAGAVLQPGTVVGDFAIINTRASVDHDCCIAERCHIGPGVTLSGNVEVGAGSHLGTGCTVIQGIKLGRQCFVAAGAIVVSDVADGQFVRGIPARQFVPSRR